jgi:hypothetical protein
MTNINVSANAKNQPRHDVELTLDELEAVSAGNKSGGSTTANPIHLKFTFKLVAVKT